VGELAVKEFGGVFAFGANDAQVVEWGYALEHRSHPPL
jgi:hypothetical protein